MLKFLQSLQNILDYMWEDEEKDWEECGKPKEGHIFLDLKLIDKFLKDIYKWVDEG